MPSIARFLLSMILILFALSAAVAARAANSSQEKTKAANYQNQSDDALFAIKQRCAADLGPGYSLQVQKTYNSGYLFICVQKGRDENIEEVHPHSLNELRNLIYF